MKKKYDNVILWKYAQQKSERVKNFIKSIKSMSSDYICLRDINNAPCVTKRKQQMRKEKKFRNVDINEIIIVIKEIESWYLAGLDDAESKKIGIPHFRNTEDITKEKFNELIPKRFDSRIDFMIEVLKFYSIEIAKKKNRSFRYFSKKLLVIRGRL